MTDPLGALIDLASASLLAAGALFYLVGAIGLNRMPDVFTRMHATSVSETLGLGLLFLGLALQAGFTLMLVKLVVIFALVMLTGPISTHALARAVLHHGAKPLLADRHGRLAPADVTDLFPELTERLRPHVGEDEAGPAGAGAADREAQPSNS